jgi:hypothetical protein
MEVFRFLFSGGISEVINFFKVNNIFALSVENFQFFASLSLCLSFSSQLLTNDWHKYPNFETGIVIEPRYDNLSRWKIGAFLRNAKYA